MAPFRAATFAAFVFAAIGGGFAAEPGPGAAAGSPREVQAAPDDPDRDDAGVFVWDAWRDCAVVPRFSQDVVAHGATTGDPEKDTLAFRVTGHDGCQGSAAR